MYLSDGDVLFFRVSFSPIFYGAGYQMERLFLEPKHIKMGGFIRSGCYLT